MALTNDRVVVQGLTPHVWEQQAIEFLKKTLPDTGQIRLWALVELVEPSGRRYEIDALVLGYHALYVAEIKSHPGRVSGDGVDWKYTFPDGGVSYRENPLKLTAQKARVLADLLQKQMGDARPWVEPLVFLSDPGIQVDLSEAGRIGVVTCSQLARAITHGEVPGAKARLQTKPVVNKPQALEIVRSLKALGIAPSKGALKLGEYEIGRLLEEGPGYQDREAKHERMPEIRRRVRTYLVPQGNTQERRDQLRRAAEREARLLNVLSDHRNILRFADYRADGPFGGPCVAFDHLDDALPLDAFLRANPALSFEERIEILRQLADAVAYCHRKSIVYRGLHPGAVLIRRRPDDQALEVRLYNFQLAAHEDGSQGTVHLSALAQDRSIVYRAPEVIEDPVRASAASDVFSLGAIAYHVLTGSPPGTTLAERTELLKSGALSIAIARDDLAGDLDAVSAEHRKSLDEVVQFATASSTLARADSVLEWVNLLLDAATTPTNAEPQKVDPLEARPGDRLEYGLEVKEILGTGSTAKVLRVLHEGSECALKVALAAEHEERLRAEAEALEAVRCDRVVVLKNG